MFNNKWNIYNRFLQKKRKNQKEAKVIHRQKA